MASPSPQKQTKQIYLAAILLGLMAGGLMLFYQKHPTSDAGARCRAPAAGLSAFAKGEVAAFLPAQKPQALLDISFQDVDGKPQKLSDFHGKSILLNLWAVWCVPCREEMPTLDKLQEKRGGNNFSVIALSLDAGGIEKPKKFLSEIKIKALPLYHDNSGAVFQDLRKQALVTGLPTSFLLDKNGCLLGTLAGPANWASEDALKLIDAAIKN